MHNPVRRLALFKVRGISGATPAKVVSEDVFPEEEIFMIGTIAVPSPHARFDPSYLAPLIIRARVVANALPVTSKSADGNIIHLPGYLALSDRAEIGHSGGPVVQRNGEIAGIIESITDGGHRYTLALSNTEILHFLRETVETLRKDVATKDDAAALKAVLP